MHTGDVNNPDGKDTVQQYHKSSHDESRETYSSLLFDAVIDQKHDFYSSAYLHYSIVCIFVFDSNWFLFISFFCFITPKE